MRFATTSALARGVALVVPMSAYVSEADPSPSAPNSHAQRRPGFRRSGCDGSGSGNRDCSGDSSSKAGLGKRRAEP
jgi:hypothetical protein